MKYGPFLKWWIFNTLLIIASIYLYMLGFFDHLFQSDPTRISIIIISILTLFSAFCGIQIWKVCKNLSGRVLHGKQSILEKQYLLLSRVGWFVSDLCLGLGLLGTIIGFIMALGSFDMIDVGDTSSIQAVIKRLGSSLGIALYTTLTGLIASILLKIQYYYLDHTIENMSLKLSDSRL